MRFSRLGEKFTSRSGIAVLMDDLGRAMAGSDDMLMLGGGNPAHIPEVQAIWRNRMKEILADADGFDRILADYDPPRGDPLFVEELAAFLSRRFGCRIGPENIAITNGGQTAFFCLINMLAGRAADGSVRKILFPLMPEYIGYADQSIEADTFLSARPRIEFSGPHTFKYHIDFDKLPIGDEVAAVCVSRPTNPTGNVLTDEEVSRLSTLAESQDIPLIIDNAYGTPFPGIIFTEARPVWTPNMILTLSLSKLGLPGTRTGIVVARPEIADALAAMNGVLSLASGNIGQALILPFLKNDEIVRISDAIIRPYYLIKSRRALEWIEESFGDEVDYKVHKSEGAMFLWLWFRNLPITTMELYERLKRRRVLIVPGRYFFFAGDVDLKHRDECLRLTYSQSDDTVREGIRILAEEVKRAYSEGA